MNSVPAKAAEEIVLRWNSSPFHFHFETASPVARDKMIFESGIEEIDRYLHAVDEIQRSVSSVSLSDDQSRVNSPIQIAMSLLEAEFRNILLTRTTPIEADSLTDPTSFAHSASNRSTDFKDENEDEAAIFLEVEEDLSVSGSPSYRSSCRSSYRSTSAISLEEDLSVSGSSSYRSGCRSTSAISLEEDLRVNGSSSYRSGCRSSYRSTSAISLEEDLRVNGSPSYRSSCRSSYRSTSGIDEIELIPSDAVFDLRSIAERMISAGYLHECIQFYASVRMSTFDKSFQILGIKKLSIGDIQKLDWAELEMKIRRWIKAARFCVRILFASEKKLCEQIFYRAGTVIDDACFMKTVNGPAVQLFNFAEAISTSDRSPEKLFMILDLHNALLDMIPDIEEVFKSKSAESIRVQVSEILSRLGETVRGIISEFEHSVLSEPSLLTVPGGTMHPLTKYVMDYIGLISDYKRTLSEIIVSKPSTGSRYSGYAVNPDVEFVEIEGKSPLELHLIWIIVILLYNLEGKSRHYKDTSLAHLFIMNNAHYIVQKIEGSAKLTELIGDVYLRKWAGKYRQAATSYQRATLGKMLMCLRKVSLRVSFSSGISKTAVRETFKTFNTMFDEVHRTQASWFIPDPQLREELRISMTENLIPAYREFLRRFGFFIEMGRHPENYIKYSVEDLENAVLDFFEGYPASQHFRRRYFK